MLLASSYPFLDVFWTILIFFVWVAWFMLLFRVFADVFRRHDIGGFAKTLWIIFVIILPFLGVFIYLITQSNQIAERDSAQIADSQRQFDTYVRTVATSGGGAAGEIAEAKKLLDAGTITQGEFDAIKTKALAT